MKEIENWRRRRRNSERKRKMGEGRAKKVGADEREKFEQKERGERVRWTGSCLGAHARTLFK